MGLPTSALPLATWRWLERGLDPLFATANPMRHLGSLACLCLLVLAATGIYLFAMLETSVSGAWTSIDALSREPRSAPAVLRSLHRYAADGFVLFTAAHLLREWLHGHYRNFRAYAWWTGVGLLPLMAVAAIGGFWLNWDALGQYSAQATAEWLDWWPLFASPLSRNFLPGDALGDRLFSLLVFVHVGVPLLLLFLLWAHMQRLSLARVMPPRPLRLGCLATLVALSLLVPVRSQAPANLALAPHGLDYDWILLFVHPLVDVLSAGWSWALLLGALALLLALPLLDRRRAAPAAVVDPENCNGCGRCVDDCPYSAVRAVPHPHLPGHALAAVDPDLCAGCGICVASCPSSTPFRRVEHLRTGIDLPQAPIDALRNALRERLAALPAGRRWAVFGCEHGVEPEPTGRTDVAVLRLACCGMLPPSFIEYALRDGADGVLVAGCRADACEFRLGQRWTAARLEGSREPHLRRSVDPRRHATVWAAPGEQAALYQALAHLQRQVDAMAPEHASQDKEAAR